MDFDQNIADLRAKIAAVADAKDFAALQSAVVAALSTAIDDAQAAYKSLPPFMRGSTIPDDAALPGPGKTYMAE